MCKSIDAAVSMINKSIALAKTEDDPRYYMDYVKLHKLLYIAQCHTLSRYGKTLFSEGIEAHRCGPLVDGLDIIPSKCGFDLITSWLEPLEFGTVDIPLSLTRDKAVDEVLEKYGTYSTEKIVSTVKGSDVYQGYLVAADTHPRIELNDLIQSGKELFP